MSGRTGPDRTDLPHEAYLVALASLDGVGPGRLRWMLSHGTPDLVWSSVRRGRLGEPPPTLRVDSGVVSRWCVEAAGVDPAERWDRCRRLGIGVVSLGSPGYPPALAADHDPPVVLFHRGEPDRLGPPRVCIIGTRRATGYGLRTAELLGAELAEAGVAVVSGLALGIDAAAHRGATGVGGAPPVAVVGGGLDSPCPVRNRALATQVEGRGVILSEVPPGVRPAPWRFPVRNRILAALAEVVVVVESARAGGSMHTVREALDRDRPVLAVPGPIDSAVSAGTNLLLSEGAHPCLSTDDVLIALGGPGRRATGRRRARPGSVDGRPRPTGDAATVLDALGWRPSSAEQLALGCGLGFRELASALGELESLGWIARSGGWVERVAAGRTIPDRPHGGA
jgi:DNA processing protein